MDDAIGQPITKGKALYISAGRGTCSVQTVDIVRVTDSRVYIEGSRRQWTSPARIVMQPHLEVNS